MFINILMLVPTLYMLQVYDRVVTSGSYDTLMMLTLLMILMLGFMGVLQWIRSKVLTRAANQFDKLTNSYAFEIGFIGALNNKSDQRPYQLMSDVKGIRQFISGHAITAFFDAPWVPVYLAVMFLFHPWYGWIAIFAALLLVTLTFANAMLIKKPQSNANHFSNKADNLYRSTLTNAEAIHGMGMLRRFINRWEKHHFKSLIEQSQSADWNALITSTSKTLRLILQSLILGAGALLVLNQEITPGLMIAGSILLGRALAPIDQLTGAWQSVVSSRGQYDRLNKISRKILVSTNNMELPEPKGNLAFEKAVVAIPGIDHKENPDKQVVLKGLSFGIKAGDVVAVIGASASGKSSLARAILGIWPTTSGHVRLDGADIQQWNRESIGPHLGYLPQDIELFPGTVKENITRFGNVDSEQVIAAAKKSGVHELILQLPDGYDTELGVGGHGLSGGQKQRIALARALYCNPKVIVLDEPNSNLDEAGEQALAQALKQCKQDGNTVIVISHRQSALFQADKILVMANGQLSMYGPREAVLQQLRESSQSSNPSGSSSYTALSDNKVNATK